MLLSGTALMLSGCVAAVIPVVAAGTIAKKKIDHRNRPDAPQALAGPRWTKAASTPGSAATPPATKLDAAALVPPPGAAQTPGAGIAVPKPAEGGDYAALIAFALNEADRLSMGEAIQSQMLVKEFDIDNPKYQECSNGRAAVALDLDDASGAPGDTLVPGLEAGLAQLRKAGIAILWFTDAAGAGMPSIRERLKASGLDPLATDRIYARAAPVDRKQTLRQAAARDYCIVALAGDTKTDLEEAYAFLRDPELGHAIDRKWNAGWFLLPPPFVAQPKKEEANALDPR